MNLTRPYNNYVRRVSVLSSVLIPYFCNTNDFKRKRYRCSFKTIRLIETGPLVFNIFNTHFFLFFIIIKVTRFVSVCVCMYTYVRLCKSVCVCVFVKLREFYDCRCYCCCCCCLNKQHSKHSIQSPSIIKNNNNNNDNTNKN